MTQQTSVAGSQRWRIVAAVAVGLMAVSLLPLVSLAQPEPVDNPRDACPDEVNPPAPFTDRLQIPEVHRLNVDCGYNNDIALGFADLTFRPSLQVQRDQFASFMVRTMRAADVDLPRASDQGFTDISGNVHEDNINVLAATGITAGTTSTTYSPSLPLRRDQIASFVLRAAAFIEDVALENLQRDSGPFTDVPAGNVHARNINGARALNLTIGRTAGTYEPATATRRDQMTAFLVRLLAALRAGSLIPAEDRAESLVLTPATATNRVSTQHTVTAAVRDDEQALLADANVRFEVYRDTGAGVFSGPVEQGEQRTDSQGQSAFAYTGPSEPVEDVIVACAVRPEETCEVVDADAATAGIQFTGDPVADARVSDVASKTWIEPPPVDEITLGEGQLNAVNQLGTDHTLTATARFQDAPVEGAEIRFEVYRAPTAGDPFTGPVESETVTTGADGVATFTYSHDAEAEDRIVVCAPEAGTCQVTDTDATADDTQFTGDPVVGAEPHIVATKTWLDTTAAQSLTARAFGLDVVLADTNPVERLPEVSIALTGDDPPAEETASAVAVPPNPLADAAVLDVAARGDLANGFAQGEAEATDVEVLLDESGGEAQITADAIHAVSTSTCPDAGTPEEASAGSEFVNLTIGGEEILNPEPNTPVTIPGVAEVVVNEVIPDDPADPGHGFTVRGLRVTMVDGSGEVIVAEAHSSVVCAGG